MRKIALAVFGIIISCSTFSQDSKFYRSFKYGMFTEYQIAPTGVKEAFSTTEYNNSTGEYDPVVEYTYGNTMSMSIMNFVYTFRYNIIEPSENFGVGINAAPNLGLSYSERGLGSFNIPAYLSLDFGAGSTYNTASNMGGYIGFGYEFTKTDIIPLAEKYDHNTGTTYEKPPTSWSEPMVIVGVRWWNKNNSLTEVSFKYGFGSNGELSPLIPTSAISNPKTFQLTYGLFLNY